MEVPVSDMNLKGKLVSLRKIREEDAEQIYEKINDIRICKHLASVPWPYKKKYAIDFVNRKVDEYKKPLKERESLNFAIELNSTKELAGLTSLHNISWKNNRCYAATWIGLNYWGKGINTETKLLLLNYAFNKLKFHKVLFETYTDNVQSHKAIEKLGAKKEALLRQSDFKMGEYKDLIVYGLLKQEWKQGKI